MEEFNKIKCSRDPLLHVYILPKELEGKSGEIKCMCKRATAKWELNEETGKYVVTPIEAKIEIGWIGFGASLEAFKRNGLFKVGTLIDYKWPEYTEDDGEIVGGETGELLVGHVNESAGICGCSHLDTTGIVRRYAVVLTMEDWKCER